MKACLDGQDEAVGKWRDQAAPVFGFTGMSGDGYRIEGGHCRPVAGGSRYQGGNTFHKAPARGNGSAFDTDGVGGGLMTRAGGNWPNWSVISGDNSPRASRPGAA